MAHMTAADAATRPMKKGWVKKPVKKARASKDAVEHEPPIERNSVKAKRRKSPLYAVAEETAAAPTKEKRKSALYDL